MPLILMCGKPCSGKSALAQQLHDHFAGLGRPVVWISEDRLGLHRAEAFQNPVVEKHTRGKLKHEVEKGLAQRDAVVILDSLNYIKGFRYELWCLARSVETTYGVAYCHCPTPVCAQRNAAAGLWPEQLFADLCTRFEMPLGNAKWDRPLFHFSPPSAGAEEPDAPVGSPAPAAAPPCAASAASPAPAEVAPAPGFKRATFTKRAPRAKAAPTDAAGSEEAPPPPPVPQAEPEPEPAPAPPLPDGDDLDELDEPIEEDSPLYITYQHENWARVQRRRQMELTNPPLTAISEHLLTATPLKQNMATVRHTLAETDLLGEVGAVCRDIIAAVVEQAAALPPGAAVVVPHTEVRVVLPEREQLVTSPYLRNLCAQFMRVAQMHPPQSKETAANMFVSFVNSALEKA